MRHYLGVLCIAVFLGCSILPDPPENENGLSDNHNENTNTNDNSDTNANTHLNDNENEDSSALIVSLGDDRQVEAGEIVYLEAQVEGGKPPYWYLWKYYLPFDDQSDNDQGYYPSMAPDFIGGLSAIEILCTEDTPQVRIEVEVVDSGDRRGIGDVVLTVVAPPDNINDNDNDNGNANDNDNANGNDDGSGGGGPVDMCPDDPAKTMPGACGCGVPDSDSDSDGTLDCNDACPNDPNKTDPGVCGCGMADVDSDEDGIVDLTVTLADSFFMSLFEGSLRLEPTVCGGVEPYTYVWAPATYLVDPDFPGSGGGAQISAPEVDFVPFSSGQYPHTLTVTDSDTPPTEIVHAFTITVNAYTPLVTDAGEDQSVAQDGDLDMVGSALGGSGNYSYAWTPGGPQSATFEDVPTGQAGETIYTLTVTDTETSEQASDTVRVVVYAAGGGSCNEADYDLGIGSARFVAYDSGFGSSGQAIVASNASIYFIDLSDGSSRAALTLPSDAKGLVVDSSRRRAYVSTRLSGQFTRSVQVIELDTPQLLDNIGLTNGVATARGMAVIPSNGKVLIAVSGTSHGLMLVNPATVLLEAALQNIHHPGSFSEAVAVAVLEQGGLDVAVVANGSGGYVTLVPLDDITFTPDDDSGGGQPALPHVCINGGGRAIAADPANSRVIVGWNNGSGKGRLQIVDITSDSTGSAGSNIELTDGLVDLGLDNDSGRGEVYAATGSGGAAVVNLAYGIVTSTLQAESTTALAVAAETGEDTILIVGIGSNLSERCP